MKNIIIGLLLLAMWVGSIYLLYHIVKTEINKIETSNIIKDTLKNGK